MEMKIQMEVEIQVEMKRKEEGRELRDVGRPRRALFSFHVDLISTIISTFILTFTSLLLFSFYKL